MPMTREETVVLTRYVKAACPQQAMDRYTPDAWFDLIGDLDLADCKQAVIALAGARQVFIAPAEIRAEVQRLRNERIARSVIPAPPPELCDDPRAYQRALREATRQAADGQGIPATSQPPAIVRDGPRRQIRVQDDPPALGQTIGWLRRTLGPARRRALPRPATIPSEQRALAQAAESRAARAPQDGAGEGREAP
jgi:hypothetical protein